MVFMLIFLIGCDDTIDWDEWSEVDIKEEDLNMKGE